MPLAVTPPQPGLPITVTVTVASANGTRRAVTVFRSESHLGLKHDGRHSGWHWQSADRVATGHDPIETGLGLPHP